MSRRLLNDSARSGSNSLYSVSIARLASRFCCTSAADTTLRGTFPLTSDCDRYMLIESLSLDCTETLSATGASRTKLALSFDW